MRFGWLWMQRVSSLSSGPTGFACAMLTEGQASSARANEHPLGQALDDRQEPIEADYPVLRQPSIRSADRGSRRMRRGRLAGVSRAFWIGALIGLLLVGLAFAVA
jgi:hypothetical protein